MAPSGLVLVGLIVFSALQSRAQVLVAPDETSSAVFPVGSLELVYASEHPDQPALAPLIPIQVELRETPLGWAAPRKGQASRLLRIGDPSAETIQLEASGLTRVLRTIVAALHDRGLYGVDVRPSSNDIDLDNERDLRPADRTALTLIVSLGRIKQVRTIAVGDRIHDDWKIDNKLHMRIREDSPLQASGATDDASSDLLNRRELEDYLFRLNRYGGRRVEAALSPDDDAGGIVLDYRVLESKPWYTYLQVANTGTNRTNPFQSRLGFTDRQLTNRDDTLNFEYLNSGFNDDVNGVSTSYQAPFFGSKRPSWMNRRKGDPGWLNWLPREKIPWWGVDRLRWEVDFRWGQSRANSDPTQQDLVNDVVNSRQLQYAGRFIYEAWQVRDFFVDLWSGLDLSDVRVRNRNAASASSGEALFVIPKAGIHAERINSISTLDIDLGVQGSVSNISEADLDGLGRDATDDQYAIVDFNLGYSTFLEPLLFPNSWKDPASELTSTLAHEVAIGLRGQYSFDYRLVPQASESLGGLYSVRGYDQSVAVGDTVLIGSFEYRFHFPRALPVTREPLRIPGLGDFRIAPQQVYGRPDWDLTLRAFVDAGRAIRNDQSATPAGAFEYNQTLVGAGIGAELQIKSNFRARIDWAKALKATNGNLSNDTKVGDDQIHVLFSILY